MISNSRQTRHPGCPGTATIFARGFFGRGLEMPDRCDAILVSDLQQGPICQTSRDSSYSYLSATIGSTFIALRAGMYEAIVATSANGKATTDRVTGSCGLIL